MIDRTADLRSLQLHIPLPEGSSEKIRSTKGADAAGRTFDAGSNFLARELKAVENLIELFVKESKERSLYEDNGSVIATSTENIKSKLDTLQQTLAGLNKVVATSNVSKQQRDHRLVIIHTLKTQFAKLTKLFKENLEKRTKALTSRQARQMKQFGVSKVQLKSQQRGRPKVFNPSRTKEVLNQRNTIQQSQPAQGYGGHNARLGMRQNNVYAAPPPPAPTYVADQQNLGPRRRGAVKQRKLQYDRSQAIRNRAVQAQNVESIITELSQVFSKVATLVSEQGELVTRIDDNLDVANQEITAGETELLKYYNNLSKERQLIVKILIVVLVLALFFVFFY